MGHKPKHLKDVESACFLHLWKCWNVNAFSRRVKKKLHIYNQVSYTSSGKQWLHFFLEVQTLSCDLLIHLIFLSPTFSGIIEKIVEIQIFLIIQEINLVHWV